MAVDVLEHPVRDTPGGLLLRLQVCTLASDHAEDTCIAGQDPERADHGRRLRGRLHGIKGGERRLVGIVEQGVSRQDGHALSVHDMGRPAAPPELVIVHGRQVVVDQGVGVDHLQRRHEGLRQFASSAIYVTYPGDQKGTQALAARHDAVPDGIRDRRGRIFSLRHILRIRERLLQRLFTVPDQCVHDFRKSFVHF